jgi:hypothetical protein
MAILPESFKAYQYQSGIDRICEAYRASANTMRDAINEATRALLEYEYGGPEDEIYDDDGILLWSASSSLSQDEMAALEAADVVREAFVTSAFHYWERSARKWTGLHGKHDFFPQLLAQSDKEYPVSPELTNLNMLNNMLKHNSGPINPDLVAARPDYFVPIVPSSQGTSPSRSRLRLTHDHVEEAFETIRASGPTLTT